MYKPLPPPPLLHTSRCQALNAPKGAQSVSKTCSGLDGGGVVEYFHILILLIIMVVVLSNKTNTSSDNSAEDLLENPDPGAMLPTFLHPRISDISRMLKDVASIPS